jgi:hypothetical protein
MVAEYIKPIAKRNWVFCVFSYILVVLLAVANCLLVFKLIPPIDEAEVMTQIRTSVIAELYIVIAVSVAFILYVFFSYRMKPTEPFSMEELRVSGKIKYLCYFSRFFILVSLGFVFLAYKSTMDAGASLKLGSGLINPLILAGMFWNLVALAFAVFSLVINYVKVFMPENESGDVE